MIKKISKYFFRVCVATVSRLILHNQQVLTIFKEGSQKLDGRKIARWMRAICFFRSNPETVRRNKRYIFPDRSRLF